MKVCGKPFDWYRQNTQWLADVRAGEYRSYYEKYYENRDETLFALAQSPKGSR